MLGLREGIAVGIAGDHVSTRRYHAHDGETPVGKSEQFPLGVVDLHRNASFAHGLGNLHAAQVAGAPLLVTAGHHSLDVRHEDPILSADLAEMTQQYTKLSAEMLDTEALATMLRRAVRAALTPPTGPVFLTLPLDVMLAETDPRPERLGAIPDAGRGTRDRSRAPRNWSQAPTT